MKKVEITYLSRNITQIFEVLDQEIFDKYRNSESENNLFIFTEEYGEIECKRIGDLLEEGNYCTTKSPIYESAERNDGKLILPINQGGEHKVITKFIL